MVEPAQGEVWWAEMPDPVGSSAGYRRPVVIIQSDSLNRTRISTVVCVPLSSNLKWAEASGNVLITPSASGLRKESVANVSLIGAIDRALLTERVGKLPTRVFEMILSGVDIVLGR